MNQLDDLLDQHTAPGWRLVTYGIMSLLGLFVLWAGFANLDEVAIAPGEVVPQGRVKTVQHLEGGIIDEILVVEGDTVREGTALVQLDLAGTVTNMEELQVRLDGLTLQKARLKAEANDSALALPTNLPLGIEGIANAERQAYEARKRELTSTRAVLEGQVTQRIQDVREVEARLNAVQTNVGLAKERLRMSADLLTDKLQSPMDHLQIQSEVESFEGEISTLRETLPRTRAALEEARERVLELGLRFAREAREQLSDTELSMARTRELLSMARDQQTRTLILSPIKGVVKNMRYTTIGGVIRPGEPILDIVPSEDTLVVEVRLNPMDRGFVKAGQSATVKIDTYDFVRYGGIDGEVISVAPDSTIPENAPPYFKVVIKTAQPWLGEEQDGNLISPGMGATVDIHTGTKSVMDYLIKPVLKLKHEAFRER
ncbi:MAG: HlyD family type I secretion periplasmic adaptor subunit [Rhodospirillaceae bacterium]|nr:HlyD family type I secretion periplasmic adaptor subunit [Rhodospirillaceae bacterium]